MIEKYKLQFLRHLTEEKMHKGKINSIVLDQSRNLMFSAGDDKRFQIFDLDTMKVRGGLKTVNSRFRCLEINDDLQRIYAGGYDSIIYIFSTKSSTLLLLKTFDFGEQYGYINWI